MYTKNSVFQGYICIFWTSLVERKTKETFVLLNGEVTEEWYLPLVLLFINVAVPRE